MILPLAEKVVDWATLGKVVVAAFTAGVVVSTAFAIAILGATRSVEMRRSERGLEATGFAVLGVLGAAVCVAAIVGGIIVMASK
jgi:multisubunit Na+/H+ antiporter MnhB subunit